MQNCTVPVARGCGRVCGRMLGLAIMLLAAMVVGCVHALGMVA